MKKEIERKNEQKKRNEVASKKRRLKHNDVGFDFEKALASVSREGKEGGATISNHTPPSGFRLQRNPRKK